MAKRYSPGDQRRSWKPAQRPTASNVAIRGWAVLIGLALLGALGWLGWKMAQRAPGTLHFYVLRADAPGPFGTQRQLYYQQPLGGDAGRPYQVPAFPFDNDGLQQLQADWLKKSVAPRDILVVYLEGPCTVKVSGDQPASPAIATSSGLIDLAPILQSLASAPAKVKVLMLDGSAQMHQLRLGTVPSAWWSSLETALQGVPNDSLWVVTDASPGGNAYVRHDLQRSVLQAATWLGAQQAQAKMEKHTFYLDEWFSELVKQAAELSQGQQRPRILRARHQGLEETSALHVLAHWAPTGPAEESESAQDPQAKPSDATPPADPVAANSTPPASPGANPTTEPPVLQRLIQLWQVRDQICEQTDRSPYLYAPHLLRDLDDLLFAVPRRFATRSFEPSEERNLLRNLDEAVGPLEAWGRGEPIDVTSDGTITQRLARAEQAYHQRLGQGVDTPMQVLNLYQELFYLPDYILATLEQPSGDRASDLAKLENFVQAMLRATAEPHARQEDVQEALLLAKEVRTRLLAHGDVSIEAPTTGPWLGLDLDRPLWRYSTELRTHWLRRWFARPATASTWPTPSQGEATAAGAAEPVVAAESAPAAWSQLVSHWMQTTSRVDSLWPKVWQIYHVPWKSQQSLKQNFDLALATPVTPNQGNGAAWLVDGRDLPVALAGQWFVPREWCLPYEQGDYLRLVTSPDLASPQGATVPPQILAIDQANTYELELRTTDPSLALTASRLTGQFDSGLSVSPVDHVDGDMVRDGQVQISLLPGQPRALRVQAKQFGDERTRHRLLHLALQDREIFDVRFQLPTRDDLSLYVYRNGQELEGAARGLVFRPFPNRTSVLGLEVVNSDRPHTLTAELTNGAGEVIARLAAPRPLAPGERGRLVLAAANPPPPAPAPPAAPPAAGAPAPPTEPPGIDIRQGLECVLRDGGQEWRFPIAVQYEDAASYVTAEIHNDGPEHILCDVGLVGEALRGLPPDATVPVQLVVHGYQRVRSEARETGSVVPGTELSFQSPATTRTKLRLPAPSTGARRVSISVDGVPRALQFRDDGGGVWLPYPASEMALLGSVALGKTRFTTEFDLAYPYWQPTDPPVLRLKNQRQPAVFKWEKGAPIGLDLHADFGRANMAPGTSVEIRYGSEEGESWGLPVRLTRDRDELITAGTVAPDGGIMVRCQVKDHSIALRNDVQDGRGAIHVALIHADGSSIPGSPASQTIVLDNEPPTIVEMAVPPRVNWGKPLKVALQLRDRSGIRSIQLALAAKPAKMEEGQALMDVTWGDESLLRTNFALPSDTLELEEGRTVKGVLLARIVDNAGWEATKEVPIIVARPKANASPDGNEPKPGTVQVVVHFADTGAPLPDRFADKTKVTIKELELTQPLDANASGKFTEVPIPGTYTFIAATDSVSGFGEYAGEASAVKVTQSGQTVIVKVKPKVKDPDAP